MASLPTQTILSLQILVMLIASICVLDIGGGVVEARKQREFDYFALALQWPGTYCQRTRHCCSTNACCRGSNAPTEFTIHGLWPDYNDGTWPACCTLSNFDIKEISTLLDGLEKYWPSLSCGSPSTCHGGKGIFWAHEWEKHGTCSFPVVRDEYEYFLATLNLYFKYNVTASRILYKLVGFAKVYDFLINRAVEVACKLLFNGFLLLASCLFISRREGRGIRITATVLDKPSSSVKKVLNDAGYVPSNSEKYPLGGVISAIQNAFHATPLLVCSNGAVEELQLCFYKDFKPRDCGTGASIQDVMLSSKSSCPKYVSLPEYVSLGLENSEAALSWLPQNEAL